MPSASADLFGDAEYVEGQIVVMPTTEDEDVLEASLLLFRSDSTGGADFGEVQRIAQCCRDEGYHDYCNADEFVNDEGEYDWQRCIHVSSAERLGDAEYTSSYESVEKANFTFLYWSPNAGGFIGVPGCSPRLEADNVRTITGSDGLDMDYWYATCDIPEELYTSEGLSTRRINLKVIATPSLNNGIRANDYTTTLTDTESSSTILPELTDFINAMVSGPSGIGGTLPCLGIFLILGLLLASMYFTGKSPISLLDITTPRLPAPKGLTAGGQILAPFGYTEMKKTLRGNMALAAGSLLASRNFLTSRGGAAGIAPSQASEIRRLASAAPATAADRAAGDVAQMRQMSETLGVAALRAGMSSSDARRLARRLTYHYGEEEHRLVSQLMTALEARGGRDALMAHTIREYMMGLRTWKTLEVITSHPELGKRSAMHQRVQTALGKAFGRYAILGPVVSSTVDSMSRTTQVGWRGTKAAFKHGQSFAREMAKTGTMAVVGGRQAFDARAAAARRRGGVSGAWYKQVTTPPHEMVVGGMYRVDHSMSHFYNKLHAELYADMDRHVMTRIYAAFGIKTAMTREQLNAIGHKDMDVVKMAGVKRTAALAHVEEEIRHIVSNRKLGAEEKLTQLMALAEKHGVSRQEFSGMLQFQRSVDAVHHTDMADYAKMLALQQVIEQHHNDFPPGSAADPMRYHSFVGRERMSAEEIWNMSVMRGMLYSHENGHTYGGGIEEALKSEWLKAVNRMVTLDPTSNMAELPEYMRASPDQLRRIRDRARDYYASMFTAEGAHMFEKVKGKNVSSATIKEMVDFTFGGAIPKSGTTPDGRKVWHQGAFELAPPKGAFSIDMKAHWLTHIDPSQSIALAPWIHRRFSGGYVPAYDPSVEARLDRTIGSQNWTFEERRTRAQQMWVGDYLERDLRNRANSVFCNHAYGGKMHESTNFYNSTLAAFMEKVMKEKGMPNNHADLRFVENMKMHNPEDLKKFRGLVLEHQEDLEKMLSRKITYDDLTGFNQAWAKMGDGGYAPYRKAMPLGDKDRILAGEVALYNRNTKDWRPFVPDEINVHFAGRSDLERRWQDLQNKRTPEEWKAFMQDVAAWSKDGGYNYEKAQIFGAVAWRYANQTMEYHTYWNQTDVKVMPKREVMPLAPSIFRMFEWEAPTLMKAIKPFRDMAYHVGDYVSRVAIEAGGELHKASWEFTPYSEYYRQLSWRNAQRIMSADFDTLNLNEQEKRAYRRLAWNQGRYDQVWAFACDRNPWLSSSSFGTQQAYAAKFNYGPQDLYSVSDNFKAYMSRGEYLNFMAHSGAVVSVARRIISPYSNMFRGVQMSMQGYQSKWDGVPDPMKSHGFTSPRMAEALQSLNPFSASFGRNRVAQALNKANMFQGSLEARQLAGNEFRGGLGAAAQDSWLQHEGVYADARIGAANPGLNWYNYRANLKMDPTMAENMMSSGDVSIMYDKEIKDAAYGMLHRRQVSAEALQIRRGQELRGFGIAQNAMFGWMNPLLYIWHSPFPGTGSFGLRNITSSLVNFVKHGNRGGSYMQNLADTADRIGSKVGMAMQPWRLSNVCYCANCGRAGYRGATCASLTCRSRLY